MAMTRRNFLEAGLGGAALSLAQAAPLVQSSARAGNIVGQSRDTAADLSIVVIGVDGSSTQVDGPEGAVDTAYIDLYLSNGATVWQYSDNIIDLDDLRISKRLSLQIHQSSYLRSPTNDILAAKRAGQGCDGGRHARVYAIRARVVWQSQ